MMNSKAREPPAFHLGDQVLRHLQEGLEEVDQLNHIKKGNNKRTWWSTAWMDMHPELKKKIDTQLTEEQLSCEEGINNLLDFLETVYAVDEMADSFEKIPGL